MKWITREKVKVDRVACPWLIKKFIDQESEFIFVPASEVRAKAAELGATAFDIEACELGHHGEDVSFNSILKKYGLTDPALVLLGEIVRAADSHPTNPHPAGEGLRWVAHGFSALGLTDHEIMQREFVVYDALYEECRRRVGATGGSERRLARAAPCEVGLPGQSARGLTAFAVRRGKGGGTRPYRFAGDHRLFVGG